MQNSSPAVASRQSSTVVAASNTSITIGTIIKGRWKIVGKVGQGSFGEIFEGQDIHGEEQVAIKFEKSDSKRSVLKGEINIVRKLQENQLVVRYVSCGKHDDFYYLVMERLGENLAEKKRKSPRNVLSLTTTAKLGIQMIECLEGMHKLGYVHRDVKPSNFVLGRTKPKSDRCFLIDFGLARKYVQSNGDIIPLTKGGFRGTARYASINAHHCKSLGRRDDMWSVFYSLVEFAIGILPWQKLKDKNVICELKEQHTSPQLVKDLPVEFLYFLEHLKKLRFEDEPNYEYLKNLMKDVIKREGDILETPFDWDQQTPRSPPQDASAAVNQKRSDGNHLTESNHHTASRQGVPEQLARNKQNQKSIDKRKTSCKCNIM